MSSHTDSNLDTPTDTFGVMAWFTKNPVAANLLMMIILVVGFFTMSGLRTESFPAFAPELVSISVSVSGGGIKDIEESVVLKIEEALEEVQGIDTIRSTITNGSARVMVKKIDDYAIATLKDDIESQVNAISNFPSAADNPVIEAATRESDAIWLAVFGEIDTKNLKLVAEDLRGHLLNNEYIKQVDVSGEPTEEIGISISEQTLQSFGWSLEDIATQVSEQSVNQYAGELSSSEGDIIVRGDFQGYYQGDFEELVIKSNTNGANIRLADVARVTDNFAQQTVLSRFNGHDAIMLKVVVTDDTSLTDAASAAKSVMYQYQKNQNLPDTIKLSYMGDQSVFINDRLDTMVENGLIGMLLVVILLALFLHPILALWVAVGIPIAFAGAMITMGKLGLNLSLNELTTSGFLVALGILVDDAIVIAESVYATRLMGGHNKRKESALNLTIKGAMKVAVPATFGVLTTIAAFYPLMFINGKLGNIFGQQAMVVIAVLIFALVESKLILPAHLAHIKIEKKPKKTRWNRFQGFFQNGLQKLINEVYTPSINWVLKHRTTSLLGTVLIFILTVGLIPAGFVRVSFFPDIEPSVVMVSFEVQDSFGQGHTREITDKLERTLIQTNAAIKEQYNMTQDPISSIYVISNDNTSASITGELIEDSLRDFSAAQVSALWREYSGALEGISVIDFDGARRGPEAIRIELKAKELNTLKTASQDLQKAMQNINGVTDIRNNLKVNMPQINIKIKPAAYSLGLTNSDILGQVSDSLYGVQAQKVQRGSDEVKVMVRYPETERKYLSDIEQLMIHTDAGDAIPFNVVAQTVYTDSVSEINRLNGYRASSVISGVDKSIISSGEVVSQLQNGAISDLLKTYPDLKIELKGEASEQSKSTSSLSQGLMVAILVIYALLAIPLRSYSKPLVIMSIIPYGVLGSIIGHWICGVNIGILSLFGTLALCGVVVNDSLVLVAKFSELQDQGMNTSQAIIEAGRTRLRAILLTSLTTFAGLTPMLLDDSSQAQFLIPMAVSLGFGILFATFTTLYALPIILSFQDSFQKNIENIKNICMSKLFGKA